MACFIFSCGSADLSVAYYVITCLRYLLYGSVDLSMALCVIACLQCLLRGTVDLSVACCTMPCLHMKYVKLSMSRFIFSCDIVDLRDSYYVIACLPCLLRGTVDLSVACYTMPCLQYLF